MLTMPSAVRVFVCTQPTDMRKSFDGLCAMTAEVIGQDPLSGALFVFRNKCGDRLKILYWGGDGLCLWYKRLERGSFELPRSDDGSVEMTPPELAMLLEGVALDTPRRKRFKIAKAA